MEYNCHQWDIITPVEECDWLTSSHECFWRGVVCDDSGSVVLHLNLPWGISGTLPSDTSLIVGLQTLRVGNFRSSTSLNGTLPKEYGSLPHLRVLDLGGNRLTGTVPTEYGSLSELHILDLGGNELTGSLRQT